MTAHWEATLNAISSGETGYGEFMQPLQSQLQQLIANSSSGSVNSLRGVTATHAKSGKAKGKKSGFGKSAKKKRSKRQTTKDNS